MAVLAGGCSREAPAEKSPVVDAGTDLTKEQIRAVVEAHRQEVRRKCLGEADAGETAQWVLHVDVSDAGTVSHVTSEGGDPAVAKCFEDEVARWSFPRGPASIDIPLHFVKR